MFQSFYNKSPVFLQNLACTLIGFRKKKKRYSPEFHRFLNWLEESDTWSLEQLKEYQSEQLRRIIQHCYETVPFYTKQFDQLKLKPTDIKTPDDLKCLPVLTKETVRNNVSSLISTKFPKKSLVQVATSGTTGAGLKFYHDPMAIVFQWSVWWRFRRRFGIKLYDRHAAFTGNPVVPQRQQRKPYWRNNRAVNQVRFSAFHLSADSVHDYVAWLNKNDFVYFSGYPSVMAALAEFMQDKQLTLQKPPRVVFCGSESVLPSQRQVMQNVFGCPVADQYGAAEHVCNLSQCEHGVYHEDMEMGVIEREVIESDKTSVSARIIATGLVDMAFPLLRYDIGDVATFTTERCSCGRLSLTASCIDGRIESYIVTPDGRKIGRMAHVFADLPNVRESQIVQDSIDHLVVKVVRSAGYDATNELHFEQRIRAIVGTEMKIKFEYVNEIPRTKNGKLRAVISRI